MAAEAALVLSGMQKLIAWGLVLLHLVEPQRGSAEIIAIRPAGYSDNSAVRVCGRFGKRLPKYNATEVQKNKEAMSLYFSGNRIF